ncbi:MAG TPA: hypothetical protein GXZ65_05815 [Clostridiales bacterium]|jgi:hypothetical protein|nr:hypothetical protein [Clostridiales bacterium]
MNKNTMNWTDNKVENTNMQQRSNPMANEQFYMDTMPVRTMPNIGTYGDNVQGASNAPGTQGAQSAQPKKQTMPMHMSNQDSFQMPQATRGDYFVNLDNVNKAGVQSAQAKKQTMPAQMSNPTPQDVPMAQGAPMTQGARGEFSMPPIAFEQGPPPVMDREYIAGYLKTLIGKSVRAEFAISTGLYLDKTGVLREVGVNYFVLEDLVTRARIMCDLYSVRFVTTL